MKTISEKLFLFLPELKPFSGSLKIKAFNKNTFLLNAGDIAHQIFFIQKGLVRLCFIDNKKDISIKFFMENNFIASFESFYLQQPSRFYIQTLEDCEIVIIDKKILDNLIANNPNIKECLFQAACEKFLEYSDLFVSYIKNSPEQRYLELLHRQPEIIKRVPMHYIASYLGITNVSLSRIRGRINKS